MFQGTQGNMNLSTAPSFGENSFSDPSNLKNLGNAFAGMMPQGHEGYTEADKALCPVMSGKIKPPVQEEANQDDSSDSGSSDEEEIDETEMPAGHEGFSAGDKDKCPVLSGKVKMPDNQGLKKKKKKKVQSGCPFMPAENKKAPALTHLEPAYEIPYISTLRHLFTFGGPLPKGKNGVTSSREKFDSYPIFLKHTLFHDHEKLKNLRKMEISQRFFVYDDFREQGNKRYHRNKHNEALSLYEHAFSLFRWLELKKEEKKVDEETKDNYDPLDSLKPMNRALITVMTDDNVELHDGEGVTEKTDIDLRTSMLLNIYLALACTYLKLNHYSAAITAVEEGIKLNDSSSQLYFRRSQARAYNKGSSLQDLYKAKEDIEKAIDMKHEEKIFQQEPSVLKILNIHNAGEIYVEHAHFVDKLINDKKVEMKTALKGFFAKLKEIQFVEEAMMQDGTISRENDEEHAVEITDEENMEFDIIREMISKYNKIIEFYLETDKKDQVQLARKELQTVLEAYTKMRMYMNFDFKNYESDPIITEVAKDHEIDMVNPRTPRRLDKMRINKVKDIFENGHFNLEVFQYAFKDYSKKKQEREKVKKAKSKEFNDAEKPKNKLLKSIVGAEFGLQVLILAVLFGLFWFWNKNSFSGSNK